MKFSITSPRDASQIVSATHTTHKFFLKLLRRLKIGHREITPFWFGNAALMLFTLSRISNGVA